MTRIRYFVLLGVLAILLAVVYAPILLAQSDTYLPLVTDSESTTTVNTPVSTAHGGDPSLVHACVNRIGIARIVGPDDTCRSDETALDWSIVGPEGPQGPQGPQGPPGPEGPQGEPGDAVRADPPCFDDDNRYVDCGNGTVMDTVTGLLWVADANCFNLLTFAEANEAAGQLNSGECGLTDNSSPGEWRLPTKEEWDATGLRATELGCGGGYPRTGLIALTDTEGYGCFNDDVQQLFTNVQSNTSYWTSTAVEDSPDWAHCYHTGQGSGICSSGKGAPKFVWAVRGG